MPSDSLDQIESRLQALSGVVVRKGNGQPQERIERAEKSLGCSLGPTFREYLARWGLLQVQDLEYLGLGRLPADDAVAAYPNVVGYNVELHAQGSLPRRYVAVREDAGHRLVCLDTARTHDEDPLITLWDPIAKDVQFESDNDFGQFVLDEIAELPFP